MREEDLQWNHKELLNNDELMVKLTEADRNSPSFNGLSSCRQLLVSEQPGMLIEIENAPPSD